MLPLKMQRPPGCRQHHHAGSGREQRGHDLGRAVQLFEIVQDQQGLTVTEVPIRFTERTRGASKMSRAVIAEALLRVTQWGLASRLGRRP